MSEQGLEVIESTTQKTHEWIGHVASAAHVEKRDAYKALRAVLHTLRDRLPLETAVHFAAQLPILLRGVYYDGWDPNRVPVKMSRDEFLEMIQARIVSEGFMEPVRITQSVLGVLGTFISRGEMEKVKHCLPKDLQLLWQEPATAH